MPRHYHSSSAKCPFYRGEKSDVKTGGAALYCAGFAGAETTKLFYRAKDKMIDQARRYCRDKWQECPLARTLEQQ